MLEKVRKEIERKREKEKERKRERETKTVCRGLQLSVADFDVVM